MIEIGQHAIWQYGGLKFHGDTIISMLIVTTILVISSILIRIFVIKTDNQKNPSMLCCAVEYMYEFLEGIAIGIIGPKGNAFIPLGATLFLFILLSNLLGLVPLNAFYTLIFEPLFGKIPELSAPTANINTTAGLAIVTLFYMHISGIVHLRFSYFLKFFKPFWWMLPLNIMEEISKPLSLAIRLFGNMFGKETMLIVLVFLVAPKTLNFLGIIQMGVYSAVAIPLMFLGLFISFIQAYIFSLLSMFYISAAISSEH